MSDDAPNPKSTMDAQRSDPAVPQRSSGARVRIIEPAPMLAWICATCGVVVAVELLVVIFILLMSPPYILVAK